MDPLSSIPKIDDEPDVYGKAWEAWKLDQTPKGNAALLGTVKPLIDRGVMSYAPNNELAKAHAKVLTIHAARTYDPTKSKFSTHLQTQMQALQRAARQQTEVMRVPERVLLEQRTLKSGIEQMRDEYGREPADSEIVDRLGISYDRLRQIRSYKAGLNTGRVEREDADETSSSPAGHKLGIPGAQEYWLKIVYDDLQPVDQRVMELTLGLNGQSKLSNQEIAARLRISPGAVTQRKAKIQAVLDREHDLSPFSE
jgi:DNA-directed RNA polymerase specialized sigma subunit